MANLDESLRPLLARVSEVEGLTSVADNESLDLPLYELCEGVDLWQLNDIDPTVLYNLFQDPGLIIRLSSDICIAFCPWGDLENLELYNEDRSVEYIKAGPEFDGHTQAELRIPQRISVNGQVFVRQTCLPLQGPDRVQVQSAFEMLLRFLTGLPKMQPGEYQRSLGFTKSPTSHAVEPNQISFSPELLRLCFAQDGWETDGRITFEFGQPLVTFLQNLEQFTFRSIEFVSTTIPRSFIERTKSSSVEFLNSELEEVSPGCTGVSSTRRLVISESNPLMSMQDVDDFITMWMTASRNLELRYSRFSTESWAYFWQSPLMVRMTKTLGATIDVVQARIGENDLCHEDLTAIPQTSWIINWKLYVVDGVYTHSGFQAKRLTSALPGELMSYFRPHHNPLLSERPPLDVRQSVMLEALLRAADAPDEHFQVTRACAHALLQPRTQAA